MTNAFTMDPTLAAVLGAVGVLMLRALWQLLNEKISSKPTTADASTLVTSSHCGDVRTMCREENDRRFGEINEGLKDFRKENKLSHQKLYERLVTVLPQNAGGG